MMQLYPAHAADALEFNKVSDLLIALCRTDEAKERAANLRFHTKLDYLEQALQQTEEYLQTLTSTDSLPINFTKNIHNELKLLSLKGAVLAGEQLRAFFSLTQNMHEVLLWFKRHNEFFPQLRAITDKAKYEKTILIIIDAVVDESGIVRDNASRELMLIRADLAQTRSTLRRNFESILRKLSKQGYLSDISEGFLNGRRTLAIAAEYKRIVKGILHGESETSKTVFIEPEEVIELNNEIFSLERAETKEIHRILQQTTTTLSGFHQHIEGYYHIMGIFDFIRGKALLAREMNAQMPRVSAHPGCHLIKAFHPLLFLHNKAVGKPTIPTNILLDRNKRMLIISGPNAGGKTVTMKTVGLLQLMVQAGLLVPVDANSEFGIFKQIMIHIGDTQSIEHELSTYSAHLNDMKYFMDFANGKTLFFIDELGSGSDPNLGGAFAEAIVEELAHKHALGIITTHYLNLKVMAGKVQGIMNGAMTFDEEHLEPLYQLVIGKPGSSYTFAIAQRTGLSPKVIERARQITDRGHFKLDKMLLQTEQQSVRLSDKEKSLVKLMEENEALKEKYEQLIDKEKKKQQHETLKLQNKIKKEELDYLRDMERKFKQIIHDWKKVDNKQEVMKAAENVLFKKKQIDGNQAAAKKTDKQYETIGGKLEIGCLLRNKINHQVGKLESMKVKRGIVRIGNLPFNVSLEDWVVVRKKG